ncbi:MAG: hypothetical protein QOK04_2066, partial [Solirubrobacteraceae bacterium]|nr:hypothetical protein [Solirubrobacteraceae bacterium]
TMGMAHVDERGTVEFELIEVHDSL